MRNFKKFTTEIETNLNDQLVTAIFQWEDTSFAHEFGTQRQGQWVLIQLQDENGDDITTTTDEKDLEAIEKSESPRLEPRY